MNDRYTLEEINYAFGGVHALGDQQLRDVVMVLSRLPVGVVDFVTENIYLSSCYGRGGAAEFIPHDFLKTKKGTILFCFTLWDDDQADVDFTIAHEIAHAFLGHKTPVLGLISSEEYEQQEMQADELAIEWGFGRPSGWPRDIRNLSH